METKTATVDLALLLDIRAFLDTAHFEDELDSVEAEIALRRIDNILSQYKAL